MFNDLFNSLGVLVFITTIVVEVLKKVLPSKIPTQIVTIIVSILCSIGLTFCSSDVTVAEVTKGVFTGFAASFISMNGFDAFKSLYVRFNPNEDDK